MANFELGNLVWKITGDTKNFDKGIKQAESGVSKFGGILKKLAVGVAGAFAFKKVADFGKRAVGLASDLAESQNAVNVVFGDGAKVLEEFGKDSVNSIGLTRTAFNELATSTGTLLKQTGSSVDDVASQTIELSKRAADTASIFNVEVNEALGAFNAALRGEAEPARKFGVNLSDAAVQAEALASGLVTSKDQITDQIKVQARYNLILKQTSDFAGDFQNTSLGFANQLKILKGRFEENATIIGEGLLPVANVAVTLFNDFAEQSTRTAEAFRDFVTSAEGAAIIGDIMGTIVGTGSLLFEVLKDIGEAGASAIGNIIEPFGKLKGEAEGTGVAFNALGIVGQALAGAIELVGVIVGGTIDNIVDLALAIKEVSGIVTGFFGLLTGETSLKEFKQQIADTKDAFLNFGEGIVRNTGEAFAAIKTEIGTFAVDTKAAADDYRKAFVDASTEIGMKTEQALLNAGAGQEELAEKTEETTEALAEQAEQVDNLTLSLNGYTISLQDLATNTLSAYSSIFGALDTLQRAQADRAIAEIDRQLQAQLEAAGLAEQSTIEKLQAELVAAKQAGDTELADEKRREIERTKLIEDAEKRKATIQYQASLESWRLQKAIGAASGAQAILAGFATQPFVPAGLAAGALATTLTGLQLAAIDAAKPQKPSFQSGGLVPQPPGVSTVGDNVGINVNPGEMILTRGQQQNLFNQLNDSNSVNGGKITIIQNNTLNTDSFEGLQRAAQQLFPALEAEGVRRG